MPDAYANVGKVEDAFAWVRKVEIAQAVVDAMVELAYANVGNEEEALAIVSKVDEAYEYGTYDPRIDEVVVAMTFPLASTARSELVMPSPRDNWTIDVVARVDVPDTVKVLVPRFTALVAPVYGMYVAMMPEVEAKVDDAYANVGNEEEALAIDSYVVDPYAYVE